MSDLLLQRYRITEDSKKTGGQGAVYEAFDTTLNRRVAIKVIDIPAFPLEESPAKTVNIEDIPPWEEDPLEGLDQLAYPKDPEFLSARTAPAQPVSVKMPSAQDEQFFQQMPGLVEARAAAQLESPNIVRVHDFQIFENKAYIIMEYLDGLTLEQLLEQFDHKLTLDTIAAIFSSVSNALITAHENKVLHLDIKPANIIITRKGVVKVTDFGIATLPEQSEDARAQLGSYGYAPLEQLRGEALDQRCDEWALASITYQMLSGENPFFVTASAHEQDYQTWEKAQKAIEDAQLIYPSDKWNFLNEEANAVLFRALDLDRDDRFATVSDFANALLPYLGDPEEGRQELHHFICDPQEDEDPSADLSRQPLFELDDILTPKTIAIAGRVAGAAGSAALGGLSAIGVPMLAPYLPAGAWGVAAICGVAGAASPLIGACLACILWGAALLSNQLWVLGSLVIAASVLWVVAVDHKGKAAGNVCLAQPWLTVLSIPFAGPFLAGYCLRPLSAVVTTFQGVVLCFSFASVGAGNLLGFSFKRITSLPQAVIDPNQIALTLAQDPSTWILATSWVLASLLFSLLCKGRRRVLSLAGCVLAAALIIGGLCLSTYIATSGSSLSPEVMPTLLTVLCCIVACYGCWQRGPVKADQEQEVP